MPSISKTLPHTNHSSAHPDSSALPAIISAECDAGVLLYAAVNDALTRVLADDVDDSKFYPMSYEPSGSLSELSLSAPSILIAPEACTQLSDDTCEDYSSFSRKPSTSACKACRSRTWQATAQLKKSALIYQAPLVALRRQKGSIVNTTTFNARYNLYTAGRDYIGHALKIGHSNLWLQLLLQQGLHIVK